MTELPIPADVRERLAREGESDGGEGAPPLCNDPAPGGDPDARCELPEGHDGSHALGLLGWPPTHRGMQEMVEAEAGLLAEPWAPQEGLARSTDPATSHAAALSDPPRKGTDRWQALIVHADHPDGLTDEELSRAAHIRLNSINTRRSELVAMGWLENSGRTRRTEAGADAVVWVLTGPARARIAAIR